jgi:hypothetical protein
MPDIVGGRWCGRKLVGALELSMHIESFELGPATFGRPWVVVQVPIGHDDDVSHNLYE